MDTLPTRWFELSRRELKALTCTAFVILAGLGGIGTWNRAVYTEEFSIYNASDSLSVPTRIDINTAPPYELRFLPGIGQARAEAIIEYRTVNGAFADIDELEKISGIGPATLKRIRPLATCSAPD